MLCHCVRSQYPLFYYYLFDFFLLHEKKVHVFEINKKKYFHHWLRLFEHFDIIISFTNKPHMSVCMQSSISTKKSIWTHISIHINTHNKVRRTPFFVDRIDYTYDFIKFVNDSLSNRLRTFDFNRVHLQFRLCV